MSANELDSKSRRKILQPPKKMSEHIGSHFSPPEIWKKKRSISGEHSWFAQHEDTHCLNVALFHCLSFQEEYDELLKYAVVVPNIEANAYPAPTQHDVMFPGAVVQDDQGTNQEPNPNPNQNQNAGESFHWQHFSWTQNSFLLVFFLTQGQKRWPVQ